MNLKYLFNNRKDKILLKLVSFFLPTRVLKYGLYFKLWDSWLLIPSPELKDDR